MNPVFLIFLTLCLLGLAIRTIYESCQSGWPFGSEEQADLHRSFHRDDLHACQLGVHVPQ